MTDLRIIDGLVAEHVMGHELVYTDLNVRAMIRVDDGTDEGYEEMPFYSSDIVAAWEVFERIRGGYSVCDKWVGFAKSGEVRRIDSPSHAEWRCTIDTDEGRYEVTAYTAPLAICLTALKAKGTEP